MVRILRVFLGILFIIIGTRALACKDVFVPAPKTLREAVNSNSQLITTFVSRFFNLRCTTGDGFSSYSERQNILDDYKFDSNVIVNVWDVTSSSGPEGLVEVLHITETYEFLERLSKEFSIVNTPWEIRRQVAAALMTEIEVFRDHEGIEDIISRIESLAN